MDSPQKVLKELSDLTRNLDVLAKEIRDMNKGNATVTKAVVQSVETKKEDSKTAATSAEKILETAAASAANGKVSRASLINEVRSQWNLSGPQIGQGLRSLCVHKYLKFDSVSGIYKIL